MTAKRMRSPSYPSTPLKEAIEIAGKLFNDARTNPVDREVAVQSMGYSGITGRSGKVLSNLIQYGLLQKAGKNEVAVTPLAMEILHPDSDQSEADGVRLAAFKPELFQELSERFPGNVPAENVLRSYLLKQGFTDAALPPAIRAYTETCLYAEQFRGYESLGHRQENNKESLGNQNVADFPMRAAQPQTEPRQHMPAVNENPIEEPSFNIVSHSKIVLGGTVQSKEDADRVIEVMNSLRALLPDAPLAKATDD